MTPQEFRAWFEGFTECMAGTPNREQWDRIKDRVKEIDGHAITYPVYVNRYVPQPYPYWSNPNWTYANQMVYSVANVQCTMTGSANCDPYANSANFNSINAMYALGKTEAIQ
jgi:hypothetical protein